METDFLFVFDNVVRDLPSVALVSYILKRRGYNCEVIHLSELNTFLKYDCPKVLILNKPFLQNYDLIFKQLFGMKVCILHTEGAMGARFLEKSQPKIDMYFFWNDADKQLYSKRNPWDRHEHPVIGCHRTDFLTEPLNLIGRKTSPTLSQSDTRLVVSLASPGGYAGLSDKYMEFKQKQINKLTEIPINLRTILSIENQVADLAFEIISKILNTNLDLKLLFKPHPNENLEIWHERFSSLNNASDLTIITDQNISELLLKVDVHICAGHCQTLSEAIMMGVLGIGFNPRSAEELFDPKWMSIGAPHFDNADSLICYLQELTKIKIGGEMSSLAQRQYAENETIIDEFFAFRDGNVCLRCADYLEAMQKSYTGHFSLSGITTRYFLNSLLFATRRLIGRLYRRCFKKETLQRHKRNWDYVDTLKILYADYKRMFNEADLFR